MTDNVIQRVTEVVRVVPIIPLYMGLAAAMPKEWSTTQVYFAMTLILGLFGWPTLARRIRSQLLSIRGEDYVVAARLAGARPGRIIGQHMLPSFTSFIIVDLVISFPLHDPVGNRALLRRPRPAPAHRFLGRACCNRPSRSG